MLVISTYVEKSEIEGLGLFAGQDTDEGDIIWFFDPSIDLVFTKEQFEKIIKVLDEDQRDRLVKWSYIRNDTVVLPVDNAKFINHSNTPNVICNGKYDVALRKIFKGEEITNDYRQFEIDPNKTEKNDYEQISKGTERETGTEKSGETDGETSN